jgi:YVTN family beta-propeller protein
MGVAVDARAGRLLVTTSAHRFDIDSTVEVLDARTGRLVHSVDIGQDDQWGNLVTPDETTAQSVIVTSPTTDPAFAQLIDTRTGLPVRAIDLGLGSSGITGPFAVDERTGRAFTTGGQVVTVLDLRRGQVERTLPIGHASFGSNSAVVAPRLRSVYFLSTIGAGNLTQVRIVDADRLQIRRMTRIALTKSPAWTRSTIAVDAARLRLFVLAGSVPPPAAPLGFIAPPGTVSMLDARTGALLHTAVVGRVPDDIVVDSKTGRAFVTTTVDNSVSILDTATGALRRTVQVGSKPTALAVDVRRGHVFVANTGCGPMLYHDCGMGVPFTHSGGSVSELDAVDGTVIRTIAVANGPIDVALDEGAGRAYVASLGGVALQPQDRWSWLRRWLPGTHPAGPLSQPGTLTVLDVTG